MMMRPIVCMSLFAMGILTMMSAHLRIAADENSPGGNPALSWEEIAGDPTKHEKQACGVTTPCIESNCYDWNFSVGGNNYKSFIRTDKYNFGYCEAAHPPSDKSTCTKYPSVKCVKVDIYKDTGCHKNYTVIAESFHYIHAKDACDRDKANAPPMD